MASLDENKNSAEAPNKMKLESEQDIDSFVNRISNNNISNNKDSQKQNEIRKEIIEPQIREFFGKKPSKFLGVFDRKDQPLILDEAKLTPENINKFAESVNRKLAISNIIDEWKSEKHQQQREEQRKGEREQQKQQLEKMQKEQPENNLWFKQQISEQIEKLNNSQNYQIDNISKDSVSKNVKNIFKDFDSGYLKQNKDKIIKDIDKINIAPGTFLEKIQAKFNKKSYEAEMMKESLFRKHVDANNEYVENWKKESKEPTKDIQVTQNAKTEKSSRIKSALNQFTKFQNKLGKNNNLQGNRQKLNSEKINRKNVKNHQTSHGI